MRPDCRGFTLLEVLVVLLVIALVVSFVRLASGTSPRTLARQQALEIGQVLQVARESAVLQGQEYGLQLTPRAYTVLRLQADGWQPVNAQRVLPPELTLELEMAQQALAIERTADAPQVLVSSSDEFTPFTLHVQVAGVRWASVGSDGLHDPVLDEH